MQLTFNSLEEIKEFAIAMGLITSEPKKASKKEKSQEPAEVTPVAPVEPAQPTYNPVAQQAPIPQTPVMGGYPTQAWQQPAPQPNNTPMVGTPIQQTLPLNGIAPVPQPMPTPTPVSPIPGQAPVNTVAAQSYTLEQLQIAATGLMTMGKQAQLLQILASLGAHSACDLAPDRYGAFAAAIRAEGAQI